MGIKITSVQMPEDCDTICLSVLCNPSGVQFYGAVPVGAGAVLLCRLIWNPLQSVHTALQDERTYSLTNLYNVTKSSKFKFHKSNPTEP